MALIPKPIEAVNTSIPVFIGYTQTASNNKKALLKKGFKITSLREYELCFGGAPNEHLKINKLSSIEAGSIFLNNAYYKLSSSAPRFYLYNSIRLFFLNGGNTCYVLSVGNYQNKISAADLLSGILLLTNEEYSTIAVPDMVSLTKTDFNTIAQKILSTAATLNKFAIADVLNGNVTDINKVDSVVADIRIGVGSGNLGYGAIYFPWLNTSVVQNAEVTFMNFEDDLSTLLEPATAQLWQDAVAVKNALQNKRPKKDNAAIIKAHGALLSASNNYKTLISEAITVLNVLPTSGAVAGIYAQVDNTRGVWKAPANYMLNGVISPTINLNDIQQGKLNVDAVTGKSINVIRSFPGKGILVWGARTIDGINNEWKYISVRRTIQMIEQSVKAGLQQFIPEPNELKTWTAIKQLIENFLTNLWRSGAFAGARPQEAYFVSIGPNNTMTADDILNGRLIVSIGIAMLRPAEFIIIRIEQLLKKNNS